ncbi:MAG: BspA family leucine-rich repeat surface protein [Bacteroidales bacterium]|nr:BspA family leucine-rich repeat surface protein [Bacteroidales bacterium]
MIKKLLKNMTAAIAALFIALVALPQVALAQVYDTVEAYVVEDGTTLTFYYDGNKATRTGTVYGIDDKHSEAGNYPAWAGYVSNFNTQIVNVVFDSSFKSYKPTTTRAWFYNCTKLQTIEGLENLNTEEVTDMFGMFCGCKELTSIDLSNFNTSNVTNVFRMFYHCSALTSLDVSGFNVAKVTVMAGMFGSCQSLTTIYCNDDWNSNTLDNSSNMFQGSTNLVGAVAYDASKTDVTMANPTTGYFSIKTPDAYVVEEGTTLTFYYDNDKKSRTGTVYGIDDKHSEAGNYPAWAGSNSINNDRITKVLFDSSFKNYKPTTTRAWFYNCTKLQTIEGLENLNTEEVTDMAEMFYTCAALTSLDLSSFNTANVTDMSNMFYNCSALTSLDVSNFNTSNVTNMEGMFCNCISLTTLDLSKFNTAKTKYLQQMFYNCINLTTIYCNDNWKTATNMMYSSYMFLQCRSLKGAIAYNANSVDVSMANPYTGYFTKTYEAYVVENGTTLTFYCDYDKESRTGTVFGIDDKHSEAGNYPAWAGGYSVQNDRITKVLFDSSFKNYKPTSTRNWFYNCTALQTINGIENLNTEKVTDMAGMFYTCQALTSLDLSSFNTAKVTDMSNMFNNCTALTSLDVSKFNTEKVTDMSGMFETCFALKSLDVTNFNTENVTAMRRMFFQCCELTSLDVTTFNTANVTDMSNMFYNCHSLTSLDLSKFDTAKVTLMSKMFAECSSLTKIYCNKDWNSNILDDGSSMFYNCKNLVGAVAYDASKTDVTMANPTTGYFTKKDGSISQVEVSGEATIVEIYTIDGIRHSELQQGLNVVRMSDGTTRKIMHRQ